MWFKKPDQAKDTDLLRVIEEQFPRGQWHLFCRTCECAYPVTMAQMQERLTREHECPACEAATAAIDGISASRKDFYLAMIEQDMGIE